MSARTLLLLGTTLLLFAGSSVAGAQANSSLTVNPAAAGPLTITTAVAGQEPTGVVASGGTYTVFIKKNQGYSSISARLSAPLPAGTTLTITLASPGSGAVSAGPVDLTTSAITVVSSIPTNTTLPSVSVNYSFAATTAAGVLALKTASVILELAP